MAYPPAVSDFKTRFNRDFVYGQGLDAVQDNDIQNALNDVIPIFNQSLWSSPLETTTAFLFLAAHLLVMNLQAAGGPQARNTNQGVKNTGGGVIATASVGGVSVAYAIAPSIANSRTLGHLMRTDYGQRYLQMLAPRLVGNVTIAGGFVDSDVNANDPSQT